MAAIEYRYNDYMNAVKENPTEKNLAKLGEWFEEYGQRFWNGETYDLEDGSRLRPVQIPDVIDDDGTVLQWRVVSWELEP